MRKTNDGFCCSFNALRPSETVDLPALKDAVAAKKLDDLGISRLMEQGLREFVRKEDEKEMVVGGRKSHKHTVKEEKIEKTT